MNEIRGLIVLCISIIAVCFLTGCMNTEYCVRTKDLGLTQVLDEKFTTSGKKQ